MCVRVSWHTRDRSIARGREREGREHRVQRPAVQRTSDHTHRARERETYTNASSRLGGRTRAEETGCKRADCGSRGRERIEKLRRACSVPGSQRRQQLRQHATRLAATFNASLLEPSLAVLPPTLARLVVRLHSDPLGPRRSQRHASACLHSLLTREQEGASAEDRLSLLAHASASFVVACFISGSCFIASFSHPVYVFLALSADQRVTCE